MGRYSPTSNYPTGPAVWKIKPTIHHHPPNLHQMAPAWASVSLHVLPRRYVAPSPWPCQVGAPEIDPVHGPVLQANIAAKARNEPPDFADAKYRCSFRPNQTLPRHSQSAAGQDRS